jgi:hypothetical protein
MIKLISFFGAYAGDAVSIAQLMEVCLASLHHLD